MKYKFKHRTIIEEYDYRNMVEHLAYKMFDVFIEENADRKHEFVELDYEQGETFTLKGEDVFTAFEEDIENMFRRVMQIEYHGSDREWRSKESLLELPF